MITEILYVDDGNLDFTVDTTLEEVTIQQAAAPLTNYGLFQSGAGLTFLQENDNFNIIQMGYRLPFCFAAGTEVARLGIFWFEPTTPQYNSIDELPSWNVLPQPDREYPLNAFVPFPEGTVPAGHNINIAISQFEFHISMVGVPASLHGLTYRVYPYILIQHNLGIAAA